MRRVRWAVLAGVTVVAAIQQGCFLFCGKSKITFENRCPYARAHDMYVDGVKVGTARPGANLAYDVAAGTYVLEQRHAATTAFVSSAACEQETTTLPRCSEITHQCAK